MELTKQRHEYPCCRKQRWLCPLDLFSPRERIRRCPLLRPTEKPQLSGRFRATIYPCKCSVEFHVSPYNVIKIKKGQIGNGLVRRKRRVCAAEKTSSSLCIVTTSRESFFPQGGGDKSGPCGDTSVVCLSCVLSLFLLLLQ